MYGLYSAILGKMGSAKATLLAVCDTKNQTFDCYKKLQEKD